MNKLCIYHGNCADGFGAAWAVRHALYSEMDYHAGTYNETPPDCTGREVIMVDFSYQREVLLEIAAVAKSVLILDHHKSAAAQLVDLPENVTATFDMDRSGAMIAWEHFNPNQTAPALLLHIQDRDLWRFDMEGTREVTSALFSYPYDFLYWDQLMETDIQELKDEGKAILRKHFKDVNELIDSNAHRADIAGVNVPAINAPHFFSSDIGHIMSKNEPFSCCYWDTEAGRTYSLRSAADGADVSEIAAAFGGGGHKNAAGFKLSHDLVATVGNAL